MPEKTLDLCGLECPQPVLKTKRALSAAAPGEVVAVRTDDPHAPEDIRIFISQSGHELLSQETVSGKDGRCVTLHRIRRKS